MSEKERLESENQSLRFQVEHLASELAAFEKTKQHEVNSLKMKVDELSYTSMKTNSLSANNDQLANEVRTLQRENQRLSEAIQMKNHEI